LPWVTDFTVYVPPGFRVGENPEKFAAGVVIGSSAAQVETRLSEFIKWFVGSFTQTVATQALKSEGGMWIPPLFVLGWLVVLYFWGSTSVLVRHWPTVLTMAFGSIAGGGTCQGSSAISFPVFTKGFHYSPEFARTFGFAVQSCGLTAASLFIFARRIPFYGKAVLYGIAAGVPGLVLGTLLVAPSVRGESVRIFFTCMQVTFLGALFYTYYFTEPVDSVEFERRSPIARNYLLVFGFLGGIFSALVVSGIDVLLYSTLAIALRAKERPATASCVLVMAALSVAGIALAFLQRPLPHELLEMWFAATPVVVFGAPAGALICSVMSRKAILYTLAFLVTIETATTLLWIPVSTKNFAAYVFSLLVWAPVYWLLMRTGRNTNAPENRVNQCARVRPV
jgi:uncharacterized membrane protein YfcA